MPEKQVRINNKPYLLNYGADQEEQLDRLVAFINSRIEPYAQRFSEYSESYLLLLGLLELADELDQTSHSPNGQSGENHALTERLNILAHHAETLVKKAEAQ